MHLATDIARTHMRNVSLWVNWSMVALLQAFGLSPSCLGLGQGRTGRAKTAGCDTGGCPALVRRERRVTNLVPNQCVAGRELLGF